MSISKFHHYILRLIFLVMGLFFFSNTVFSQFIIDKEIDPFFKKASTYRNINPDSCMLLAKYCDSLAASKNNIQYRAMSNNLIGIVNLLNWNLTPAKAAINKGLKFAVKTKNDSLIGLLTNNLGLVYDYMGIQDSALTLFNEAILYYKRIENYSLIADAYNNIGLSYYFTNNNDSAKKYYAIAIKKYKIAKDSVGIADIITNQATISYNEGSYVIALQYYVEADKIYDATNNKIKTASTKYNIAGIHTFLGDNKKALNYINECIKLRVANSNDQDIAAGYYKKAIILSNMNQFSKANDFATKSLNIYKKADNKKFIAACYNLFGTITLDSKKYDTALQYFNQSIEIKKLFADSVGIASSILNIANVYYLKNNFIKALNTAKKGFNYFNQENEYSLYVEYCSLLASIYSKIGDYKNALKYKDLYISGKDSLINDNKNNLMLQYETVYQTEKKEHQIDLLNKENLLNQATINIEQAKHQKEKILRYALFGGISLLLIFSIFIFNRFKITRKQKSIIEIQKKEVEEKNKEITDSITYAKRIQSAILPPLKIVKEYLKESFILYKPKDIVAGDFYWMEGVSGSRHTDLVSKSDDAQEPPKQVQGNVVLFASADCTGHGVPGAMVSVVCNNALNRSVREHNLIDPGAILDKTREIVVQEFEKSEEEVKDGMDIALCSLENNTLKYAGANNPLWIIRNNEIIETKANKQPIGKFENPKPYTTHIFELQKGDAIYIFSDGYVDQFGGEKGKKFKAKAFRELLLSIQTKPMEEQRIIIDETFEIWKGNLEQIDDVCLIGVRI